MKTPQRPGIPAVDFNMPPGMTRLLLPMKENIEIMNGLADWQRMSVTLGMLVNLGIITEQQAQAVARL